MHRLLFLLLGAALAGCGDDGSEVAQSRWPLARAYTASTPEDTPLQDRLPPATGPDGGPVVYTLYEDARTGAVELAADGTFTYTPPADYNGLDVFRYRLRDDQEFGPVTSVIITVVPVNDAPRIRPGPVPAIPVSSGRAAFFPETGQGNAVALDAAGRIHVAGSLRSNDTDQFAVARFADNGELDLAYGGGDGIATASIGSTDTVACRLVIDDSGRAVVAVRSYSGEDVALTLARFTAEGTLDTSFGAGTGMVKTPVGTYTDPVIGLALDGAGRVLIAGATRRGAREVLAVARYSADGVADATFGTAGIVTTAIGTRNSAARAIAVDRTGRVVVAGFSEIPGVRAGNDPDAITLVRYSDAGRLDATFGGGGGVVTTSLPSSSARPGALALDDDGRIIVAGYEYEDISQWGVMQPIVARYTADGALDASFNGGIVRIWFGEDGEWSSATDVAVDPRGNVLVAGTSWGYFRQVAVVARLSGSGVPDTSFGAGAGLVSSTFGHGAGGNGIALDSSGRVLLAGTAQTGSHVAMTIARYSGEGVPDPGFNNGGEETFWFPVDRRFHDVDGDNLTYTATLADGSPLPPEIRLEGRVLSGKAPADAGGVVVTATDPAGLSATETYGFLRSSAN